MKKILLLIVIALGVSFAFAHGNDGMNNKGKANQESVISEGNVRAEVISAEFDGKDKIIVKVKIYEGDDKWHDVKVYPTNNGILSSVTSSARTVSIYAASDKNVEGKVEFPCMSQKTEDLQYCNAYAFAAQVLN